MPNRMTGRLSGTRRRAVLISVVAAVLAAVLLVVYLRSYRSSVNSSAQPERVLVATHVIPNGTSATTIAQKSLYQITTVPKNQLAGSAIADPSALSGRIAATTIFPGEQLTQQDFTTENATALPYQLTGTQRAVAVPVDSVHGLLGQVAAGDFVDVYVSIAASGTSGGAQTTTPTQVRLLAPNVLVLATPSSSSTSTSSASSTVLRVNTTQAAKFAYAADYDRIWLILRPQTGAKPTPATVATLSSLLQGA